MAKKVKVILLENIDALGSIGQIVSVADGYARNFLFPQGKAALATAEAEEQAAAQTASAQQQTKKELDQLQAQAESLDGTELTLKARVKDGDAIYGSISTAQIVRELNSQADLKLKAKDITIEQPITRLGSYDATINLSPEVTATIQIIIAPEPDQQTDAKT